MAPALVALAACAPQPMSQARAERLCADEARLAGGIAVRGGLGAGSGGPAAQWQITLTNRILAPQTREAFLADCVARRRSGGPAPTTVGITIGGSL